MGLVCLIIYLVSFLFGSSNKVIKYVEDSVSNKLLSQGKKKKKKKEKSKLNWVWVCENKSENKSEKKRKKKKNS